MLFINLLLALTITIGVVLSLVVIVSNPKKRLNQSLSAFTFAISIWLISNLLTNLMNDASLALIVGRTTLIGAAFIPFTFMIFVSTFLGEKVGKVYIFRWGLLPLSILVTVPTKYNLLSIQPNGLNAVTGQVYYLLALELLLYFGTGLIALNKRRMRQETPLLEKQQIKYINIGIILGFIPAFIINAILPIFSNSNIAILLGPNSVIFMAIFMSFAIVRHKFLDIKVLVARSLGYILTLTTLVGTYVLMIFGLSSSVLGTGNLTGLQQLLYILATLIFGFSLAPLKRFFDKITNRLFYRDSYDAQDLLDRLNKMLVGNIDLDVLLKQTSGLIGPTLKAQYCSFVIRGTDNVAMRVVGSKKLDLDAGEVLSLDAKTQGKIPALVADELEESHAAVKQVLSKNDIAVANRLAAAGKTGADLGYLLLGPKQSGNPYNKQDLQVLDIIANELVIAIQNALRFEEIETFNITLQQKVNDATRQLRQTNEKLKALDETKDEFISMASHQLRTPLTAVKGYVSMVVEGDAGKLNKQQKELLDQAFASSQRMVYLIADLLNVSRLKSGKFVIENKPTQLADVVESEMEQLTEVAKGKNQTITYNKPDKFPELMLDETKIRQVIMNFADNALHYTQNGGHIQISLVDTGNSVEYTVVDDGLGVPKAEQHHLFTKFFRAGNAKKARPDGTGLGLFMAKKVIIAQGGAIIFKSEEGKGSTFGFTFPKSSHLPPSSSSK